MVTGDHPLTARAVAGQIGLGNGDPLVMSGEELHAAVANGESQRLEQVDVIARASPAEKLILVRALQAQGHIVAVTGDGVNDVPALQAADIGIAMGERGTRSAREVASIVLLEDNFRTIVDAIAEGRQLFRNLQSSFKYVLMTHIPLVITAALVPLGGYPLLYLPVHIIWLEMLIHPTAMLVFQELPARELRPTGQALRPRFFSRREWVVIVSLGLFVTALVAAGYLRSFGTGEADHGRAMAMAMLTLASAAITIVLSRLRTPMSRIIVGATVALGLVLIEVEPLARRLNLAPLHADDWMLAVGANVLVGAALLAGELWSSPGRPRRA
jgi:Ca2+-transporting ATPase